MRRILLCGIMFVLGSATTAVAAETKAEAKAHAPFAHIVVFRMKKNAPKDAVSKAIADCHELLTKIRSVRSVRAGRPAAKGTPDVPKMDYDFALLVLVDDAAGLEEYLKHPQHLKFVDKHGPFFDMTKLQVFDFQNQMK